MKVIVTGAAGFIGAALTERLLKSGCQVIGIDNHNDYYDPELKSSRLLSLQKYDNYKHHRINISDREEIEKIFASEESEYVVHLAAQAGVRYSIDNPFSYIDTNLVGFGNILECCRRHKVQHLVYASSSSVYGANMKMPFSTHDSASHPISLYAATKKANELMAHSYSHLYRLPTTGLRFFTAYGPWDRPDMALQSFTRAILARKPIKIFNYGKHKRDFTYIDDIVEVLTRIIQKPAEPAADWDGVSPDQATSSAPWRLYNVGSNNPVELMSYITALENALGVEAIKEFLPMQPGDVPSTYADVDDLVRDFSFKPSVSVEEGVTRFAQWYREYYE